MSVAAEFAALLANVYRQAPGQALPNALWKTLGWLEGCQTSVVLDTDGKPQSLEASRDGRLLVYWSARRSPPPLQTTRMEDLRLALVHHDFLPGFPGERFPKRSAYFKLWFHGKPLLAPLPDGFSFRPVQPKCEAQAVADLIVRCYETIHPSAEIVRSWAEHPVYQSDLWLWIWDDAQGQPAGLGIAELDAANGEGALEWVQVLPEYQGRGLGGALVTRLVDRLRGRAAFITVSGEVDNQTRPEQLYRRCGFTGDDIWWVLQPKD